MRRRSARRVKKNSDMEGLDIGCTTGIKGGVDERTALASETIISRSFMVVGHTLGMRLRYLRVHRGKYQRFSWLSLRLWSSFFILHVPGSLGLKLWTQITRSSLNPSAAISAQSYSRLNARRSLNDRIDGRKALFRVIWKSVLGSRYWRSRA